MSLVFNGGSNECAFASDILYRGQSQGRSNVGFTRMEFAIHWKVADLEWRPFRNITKINKGSNS